MKIMTFNTQHCLNYLEQKIDFAVMAKAILDGHVQRDSEITVDIKDGTIVLR